MKLYRGVIEDNNHPDMNGQCRVRIYGLHPETTSDSDDFNYINTSDLPWADVMGSVELGLNSGIGLSTVPRQGTMVWVMLEDDDPNKPVIMGTATGVPTESSSGKKTGFVDPAGVYPLESRLGQPDTSPVVRDSGTPSVYTELSVLETQSGHVIEIDDTPSYSRIKIKHSSGSTIEIDNDGKLHITTVDDVNVNTDGDINISNTGNTTINTEGNMTLNSDQKITVTAGTEIDMNAPIINLN